jgi:hypothetical protein
MDPQVLAQILRSRAGALTTPAEANSFLAAQPTPSMDYMRQTAGAAMTPAEMARMAQMPEFNRQSVATLTPYQLQQLQMMQGR